MVEALVLGRCHVMKVYLDLAKVCASTCDFANGINST